MKTDPERAALLEAISAHLPGWQVKGEATGLRASIKEWGRVPDQLTLLRAIQYAQSHR